MFLPSLWADRGPVADTDGGTVGYGRGGTNLRILGRVSCCVLNSITSPSPFAGILKRFDASLSDMSSLRFLFSAMTVADDRFCDTQDQTAKM